MDLLEHQRRPIKNGLSKTVIVFDRMNILIHHFRLLEQELKDFGFEPVVSVYRQRITVPRIQFQYVLHNGPHDDQRLRGLWLNHWFSMRNPTRQEIADIFEEARQTA